MPYHQLYSGFIPSANKLVGLLLAELGSSALPMTDDFIRGNHSTSITQMVSNLLRPLSPGPGQHVGLGCMGVMALGMGAGHTTFQRSSESNEKKGQKR